MESELLIAAILISSWVSVGLSDQPSCVAGLSSCLPFLKGDTKPSPQCCINVLNAVEKDLPCLCNVLNNAAFLHQFNVTKEEALALPSKCGHTPVNCPNNGTAPSPSVPEPPPAVVTGGSSALHGCGLVGVLFFTLLSLFLSSFQIFESPLVSQL